MLTFKTIDLTLHADTAASFRRDSYVCSFGSDEALGSVDDYLAWLGFLEVMRTDGADFARLSVSPSNARALAYYRKHGWQDLGPRPGDSTVHLMELRIGS